MSFLLQAPHPNLQTSSFLPNPRLGDSEGSSGTVSFKRTMNGVKYTYVKSRDARRKMVWSFWLSKYKALEVREFYNSYNSSQIRVTDHLGKTYIGYFTNNPFEIESVRRALASPGLDTLTQIQITFEGFEQ